MLFASLARSATFSSQPAETGIFNYVQYSPPPLFQTIARLNACTAARGGGLRKRRGFKPPVSESCCISLKTVERLHKRAELRLRGGRVAPRCANAPRSDSIQPRRCYIRRTDVTVSAYTGNEKIAVDKSTLTRVAEEIPPASHRISSVPSETQTQWPMCCYFHQR